MIPILCRLPNHIGNTCMCLPALRLLEASGYTPALVGRRWAGDLVAGMGWRFDPIEGHFFEDFLRIRFVARNAKARKGLLFPNSFSSALLFKFARLQSTGIATNGRSLLLKSSVKDVEPLHQVERYFYLVKEAILAWGGTPAWTKPPKSLGLLLLKRHEAAAKNLIEEYAIPKKFAVLAPAARGQKAGRPKYWPYFNRLVAPLRAQGIEPIVFPSLREETLARDLCPDARILPPTTLGNFAAILKRAQFVIANDSGVSHIAAGLGVKQLTLVGVTDPAKTSPWNQNASVLGSKNQWPDVESVLQELEHFMR